MDTRQSATIGDIVSFSVSSYEGVYGIRLIDDPSSLVVDSSDNPVSVLEVGSDNLDYLAKYSQLMHLYGEVDRPSNFDCGTYYACYVVGHDGTDDLIRLPVNNEFGLDPDYEGGLCAEVIAPVGLYTGLDGDAVFLDVTSSTWMRTWNAP
jgi:hypothetical protein